jgi:hypothetical protein
LERATPSVSATIFTANRRVAATATASSVFPPCYGQCLIQYLDRQRFAAEQPFEVADTGLELAHAAGADHVFIRSDSRPTAFGHQLPPLEQQAWGDAMQASDR